MVTAAETMPADTILSVQGLETRFGRRTIHKDLSLDIRTGEVLVLFGGSGSGKSTLLRTLIGLERPSKGKCTFDGKNLFRLSEREWTDFRKKIAYAFQGGALFDSLTVEENLLYPLDEHTDLPPAEAEARVSEALVRFGLEHARKLLPAALSGGMQKRAGLARAVMLDPAIILYDEPTAGLDPGNTRKIVELILALKAAGKTSVLVTHDTACGLLVADRIALIKDGRIEACQTIAEVRAAPHPEIDAYLKGETL